MDPVATGLDVIQRNNGLSVLKNRPFGVLANHASLDQRYRHSAEVLDAIFPGQLKCVFSPQHGFWAEEQANMIESGHSQMGSLAVPLHSLYAETRRPTASMLNEIEVLVVDLQDVGTRVYTFIWTLLECLRSCAEQHVAVVVLDRPNPLGGFVVEGPILNRLYRSFVGGCEIPMRHALTIGEVAKFLVFHQCRRVDLAVVPMQGWNRSMTFHETGLPWVGPSPNMPRLESALLYPGMVLFEGTNISEGRGTTLPFEVVGAPFLDDQRLADTLNRLGLPGVIFRPIRFRPTFDKWQDELCRGVQIHITEPENLRSFRVAIEIMQAAADQARLQFEWNPPPYEYEHKLMPIDILYGSDVLRSELKTSEAADLCRVNEDEWLEQVEGCRIYS